MTFSALYTLLSTLIGNREMYDSYLSQNLCFRIRLVKARGPVRFDVVKASKKTKTKTGKKYEYVTATEFTSLLPSTPSPSSAASVSLVSTLALNIDNSSRPLTLACQIHSNVLDSHFAVSAAELRSLGRTDRDRAQAVTNEGGDKVRDLYFGPCLWTARLHLPVEDVFAEGLTPKAFLAERLADLNRPLLVLQDPQPT